MALPNTNTALRRFRNRYRLVVINEDTFKEVVAFKMNRWTVYIGLSTLFIMLIGLTIMLLAFTPLKYYIPGYGIAGQPKDYEALKAKADSIENVIILKQQYINDIEKVLKGDVVPLDTTTLKVNASDPMQLDKKKKNNKKG